MGQKAMVIDTDISVLTHLRCRRQNTFKLAITFKDKNTGLVEDISSDTFVADIVDDNDMVVLQFTMASGFSIVNNKLNMLKGATEMTLPAGEYSFSLLQNSAGEERTRMHGTFEVKTKGGE